MWTKNEVLQMLPEDTPERRVQQLVEEVDRTMREVRFDPSAVTFTGAVLTLSMYYSAFRWNFLPWMAETLVWTKSPVARRACAENLICEIRDDHPGMLDRFMNSMDRMPLKHAQVYHPARDRVRVITDDIDREIRRSSAVPGLATLATLEVASVHFMPWLRVLASQLGGTDFEYVEVHGEADKAHADALVTALTAEHKLYDTNFSSDLARALALVTLIFEQYKVPDPQLV